MSRVALLLGCVVFCLCLSPPVAGQSIDAEFKPELAGVDLTSREVRPGDPFAMTVRLRNAGTKVARDDYRLFVHIEEGKGCRNMVIHADHPPAEPTTSWQPGQTIVDGPQVLMAPADLPEGEYFLHIGVYDSKGKGGRLLDSYAGGKLKISRQAPSADQIGPPKLPAGESVKRRAALAARIPADQRVTLQTPGWRFDVDRNGAAWALTDKSTGVLWTSDPARPCFGELLLRNGKRSTTWRIDRFDDVKASAQQLQWMIRPVVDGKPCGASVIFTVEPVQEPDGLRLAYAAQSSGPWQVVRVRLLDNALTVTEEDAGRVYVPHRLGIERVAARAFPGSEHWRTYDNLSMAMCGLVKEGSALLVNWDCVDTQLDVTGFWPDLPLVGGRRAYGVSLEMESPQGACTIHPLGRGDYVQIAHAYRALAKAKGWLQPWSEKRKSYPTVDRIFGAADFKPFVLSRVVPSSRHSHNKQEHVHLGFTFDEVAQCAEHWRNDLGIDRAFVVLAGWIHRGYDVGHPDVLPAAPECGGNDGLVQAARRIRACGYLFGLHDNYQDMYEDAPSWGQQWLNKDSQGVAKRGGNWNGGQAWQVCAIKQVDLAARSETNLPKIAQLFAPTIYFIDTVFAWGLVTCEDPAHPMTRLDDLKWKTRLCLLAKQHFGLFGSEEGREWSVPCADYLEGIFGQQTDSPPGSVIPLFPLVYNDCVQIMTHQSNRIGPGDEKKVADHILFAQMPLPSFGSHLYWKQAAEASINVVPLAPVVKDLGGRRFAITYRWKVGQVVPWNGSIFVHFTRPGAKTSEGIAFQNDHAPKVPLSQWQPGIVEDGPYTVAVPLTVQGQFDIRSGVLHDGQRVALGHAHHDGMRYHIGTITVQGEKIECQPATPPQDTELWSRGNGGWGEHLCPEDRVIKNAWEVLSPLNTLTAQRQLSNHEFLTPDRLVQRTCFGDAAITVAYEKPARIGDNVVPAYGFIVESPGYVAFCATRYNGLDYTEPALFTVRSLDGKPIAESSQVRIYHGFGNGRIRLLGKEYNVEREDVVRVLGGRGLTGAVDRRDGGGGFTRNH
jgi:hypothetical protein